MSDLSSALDQFVAAQEASVGFGDVDLMSKAKGAASAVAAASKLEAALTAAKATSPKPAAVLPADLDELTDQRRTRKVAALELANAKKRAAEGRGGKCAELAGLNHKLDMMVAARKDERAADYSGLTGSSPLYVMDPNTNQLVLRGWRTTVGKNILAKGSLTRTSMEGKGQITSMNFAVYFDTLSFKAGLFQAAAKKCKGECGSIRLYTGWDGLGKGTIRRAFVPTATNVIEDVVWDVSEYRGETVVVVVTDSDSASSVYFNDLKMFNTAPGCLPECLKIQEQPEGFKFMSDSRLYKRVGGDELGLKAKAPGLYCRDGLEREGANQGTNVYGEDAGWPARIKWSNLDGKQLPSCLYIERSGPSQYGIRVEGGKAAFAFDNKHSVFAQQIKTHWKLVPKKNKPAPASMAACKTTCDGATPEECKALRLKDACRCGSGAAATACDAGNICSLKDPAGPTKPTPVCYGLFESKKLLKEIVTSDESLYCIYPTKQPRCAAFNGILKPDSRMRLICDAIPAEPSCLGHTISGLCKDSTTDGPLCGSDKTTRDVMKCCDSHGNKPGYNCNHGRRRRLGAALKYDGFVREGQTAEDCATMCLMHNDGLATHKDGCVAWRLTDKGFCEIATTCYPKKGSRTPENWHVLKGVSPFKPPYVVKYRPDGVAKVTLVRKNFV